MSRSIYTSIGSTSSIVKTLASPLHRFTRPAVPRAWSARSHPCQRFSGGRPGVRSAPRDSTPAAARSGSFTTHLLISFALVNIAAVAYLSKYGPSREEQGGKKGRYATPAETEKAIAEITALLGADAVSRDEDDLHSHGFSDMSSVNIDQFPVAVVYPQSTEEVSQIAKTCYKYRVPMIPYSGGTSLEGNFSAPHGGLSIDFTHMDRILDVHPDDLDVVVQPALGWMSLNAEIAKHNLFFPVDPGPSARIGGMVGTNCSGTNAVRYGTMKDWVINLTVVLADGTIIKTRRRPRKSSAGYNLTSLFVGSEGTLGMVTEITLKLSVIPKETSVAVVTFPTIRDVARTASMVMRAGIPIAAMEVMDAVQMRVINQTGVTGKTNWPELPTMFFKFSGTASAVAEHIQLVRAIARTNASRDFHFAQTPQARDALWSARKEALWSMLALRDAAGTSAEVWSTDVAVPLSRLPDLIEQTAASLPQLPPPSTTSLLGHIGDGNFHASLLYDARDAAQHAAVRRCVDTMVARALAMDGTCSGEHGIGLGKKGCLIQELGAETVGVMVLLKKALDPRWLMNPGKVVDWPGEGAWLTSAAAASASASASATDDEHGQEESLREALVHGAGVTVEAGAAAGEANAITSTRAS